MSEVLLGRERTKDEGTFALDFELNQRAWTDTSSGGPIRTPGDIVVGFELQGNPDNPQDLQVLVHWIAISANLRWPKHP
jgi:hypothetical protein